MRRSEFIWWLLLGVLLIAFAVMDGFDLGTGMLLPFIARTDSERRIVINTVGPVWEGNQVWLILGAGAIFAAWPAVYGTAFSGFYLAMFLLLCSLILRPVGFKFRSKMPGPRWRETWDWLLFLGGFVPALIFGVAVGNALRGVPFRFDDSLRLTYEGGLIGLLNPYALLCGLVSVTMLVMHGGAYLAVKAAEPVAGRARRTAFLASFVLILLFVIAGLWTASSMGYRIIGTIAHDGPSNPLIKMAEAAPGAWLANYSAMPWTMLAPLLAVVGALLAAAFTRGGRRDGLAWIASALSVVGVVATAGVSMFPFILPSSLDPRSSLTVWDFILQPDDAGRDADCRGDLRAAHHHLYELRLSCAPRPGDGAADRRRSRELLKQGKETGNVVFQLDPGSRPRLLLRDPQCHVVRGHGGEAGLVRSRLSRRGRWGRRPGGPSPAPEETPDAALTQPQGKAGRQKPHEEVAGMALGKHPHAFDQPVAEILDADHAPDHSHARNAAVAGDDDSKARFAPRQTADDLEHGVARLRQDDNCAVRCRRSSLSAAPSRSSSMIRSGGI